jgi:tetratricopeptide (TPR) repeat protein
MLAGPAVLFENVLDPNALAAIFRHVEAHCVRPGIRRESLAACARVADIAGPAGSRFIRFERCARGAAFPPIGVSERQPGRDARIVPEQRGRVKIRTRHSLGIVTRRDMATNRMEILKSMLAQNPRDTFARYGLAMEYVKSGELASAVAEFEALLDSNPDYAAAYFHGGQALEKLTRIDAARVMYQKGIQAAARIGDGHAASELQAALDLLPI